MQGPKISKNSPFAHHSTTLWSYIFATKAFIDNRKKLVKRQYLSHMFLQYGELRPTIAETDWRVWGTPANFNRFRVLAALLDGMLVVGVSQTLRRWTETQPIFGRAAITLGIGPHSSYHYFTFHLQSQVVLSVATRQFTTWLRLHG